MRPDVEDFARILVEQVRDAAVRACDLHTKASADTPAAERWRAAGLGPISAAIPEIVDETVFQLLRAIDEGALTLKFVADAREIDLGDEGEGELAGWYMGTDGWRAQFSKERFVDDFASLTLDDV